MPGRKPSPKAAKKTPQPRSAKMRSGVVKSARAAVSKATPKPKGSAASKPPPKPKDSAAPKSPSAPVPAKKNPYDAGTLNKSYPPLSFKGHPEFTPNLSPQQVFELGAFGGTYWRPIHSGVVKKDLRDQHKEFAAFKGIPDKGAGNKMTLAWSRYDKDKNHFKAKCGATLEEWEQSGWITRHDPYGWFQWYCRFYEGRRLNDGEDARQIGRWQRSAGPRGRFARRTAKSAVVKQVLLHWAVLVSGK
eukprot:Hpha_TRINITY_DN15740_c1_g6::TRINITY_DN15740_c1_g6_i1::g.37496::m.37496